MNFKLSQKYISYLEIVVGIAVVVVIGMWLVIIADRIIMPLFVGQKKVISVPDLYMINLTDAEQICAEMGLVLTSGRSRIDPKIPANVILDQYPLAGSQTKSGRRIEVVYSAGDKQIVFPNFVGRSIYDSWLIADSCGFALSQDAFKYVFSDEIPERVILQQNPPAQTIVSPIVKTTLTISLGKNPDDFRMPNLVGRKIKDIDFIMAKYSIRIGNVSHFPDSKTPAGTILSHSPATGEEIYQGQSIDFSVAGLTANQRETVISNNP